MYRKYSEFLPAYLGGNNISRHSNVLEHTDNELYNRISLLGLWNVIRRPILIERVQEEPGTCTINIHVNTESPIKNITTTGLSEDITEQYQEQDLVTEVTLTTTATDTIPAVMPQFIVTVETYDDRIYKKGYLENDTVKNDIYDHDEFLDLVGSILGIPRRIYKDDDEYDTSMYEQMYPKYFTKQMYSDRHTGHITEDDYYYAKRLQRFVTEYGTKPLLPLMAELLYEWDDITISSMLDRTTSIRDDIEEYTGTPVIQLIRGNERYINLDYSNMLEIMDGYVPITRPILLSEPTLAYPRVDSTNTSYINNSYVEVSTRYAMEVPGEEEDTGALLKAPVKVYYQGETGEKLLGTYYSDDNGTVRAPINALPLQEGTIKIESVPEYEYYIKPEYTRTLTVQPSGTVDMSVNAWEQINYSDNPRAVTPFFDNTIGALNVGYFGYCVTPVMDLAFLNIIEHSYKVTIKFSYVDKVQIGLEQFYFYQDGTVSSPGNWVNPYSILGGGDTSNPHILECIIQDGVISYYLDGENTEITQQLPMRGSNSTKLYIVGRNNTRDVTRGLYIWNARLEEIIDLQTTLAVETISTVEGNAEIQATLTSGQTGINNALITCKNGTSTVTSATTDSNGVCTLDLSSLTAGSYTLTVQYDGDSTYGSTSTTHTITITNYSVVITDDCTTLGKWLVTDTGTSAYITSQTDIPCVRPPTTGYQRVYWEYPLKRGTNSSIKFKVYITTNATGIILGTMEKYGQDHMTSIKSWWAGLGGSNNWTDGPNNSQNRHGGTRMSYSTWHTIEFELEDNVLHTYVDDVSVRDYTIPSDLSSNQYFNDYFFLGFSGNGIWIRDIEYDSNTSISDDTLNSIRSAHMAQFE